MNTNSKLLLVGCGKMGSALLQRLIGKMVAAVVDPGEPTQSTTLLPNVSWFKSPDQIPTTFHPAIVVLAVKPQHITEALPAYVRFKGCVFLSIAAGVPIKTLENVLKGNPSIVRAMPNLPASIGQGMSVAVANAHVSPEQHHLCEEVLRAVGEIAWVENESLIDTVTALSGSGPAYIFALCEAMAKAGTRLGLSATIAMKLARQTIIGSGALLEQSHESAGALRAAVTSPGGTTEAALGELLAEKGLDDLMLKAMTAALERAHALGRLA